jgi:magnesium-transporting ATPase (P-type)
VTVRALYTLAYPTTKFGFTGVGYNSHSGHMIYLDDHHDHYHESARSNSSSNKRKISDETIKSVLAPLLYTGCLCNNATVVQQDVNGNNSVVNGPKGTSTANKDGTSTLSGQPTELALLVAAMKAGYTDPRPQYHRIQEMPFSSDRKRMDVRARPVNGKHICSFFQNSILSASISNQQSISDGSLYFVKGMPEKVISECTTFCSSNGAIIDLDEDSRTIAFAQSRRMAASGLRVIALGYGPILGQLTFAGLIGMEDPPRDGVADSVRQLREGGVKCLMITGDAKETAIAIAKRCGIVGGLTSTVPDKITNTDVEMDNSSNGLNELRRLQSQDTFSGDEESMHGLLLSEIELGSNGSSSSSEAMSGTEIDEISIENLASCINGIRVFYRVSPRHKLAIVRACMYKRYTFFALLWLTLV